MGEQVSRTLLAFQLDKASFAETSRGIEALRTRFKDLKAEARELSQAAHVAMQGFDSATGPLQSRLRGVVLSTDSATNAVQELRAAVLSVSDAYERVEDRAQRAGRAGETTGGQGRLGALDRLTGLGAQIAGDVGLGGLGNLMALASDLASFGEALPAVKTGLLGAEAAAGGAATGLGTLVAAALPLAAAGAAVALVLGQVSAAQTAAAESARVYAERIREINGLLAEGATSADLQQQRTQALADFEAAQASVTQLAEALRNEIAQHIGPEIIGIGDVMTAPLAQLQALAEALPLGGGSIGETARQLRTAQQDMARAGSMAAELGSQLLSGATAVNDAIAQIQAGIAQQTQAAQLMRTGTVEQVQAMIAANQDQIAALEAAQQQLTAMRGESAAAEAAFQENAATLASLRAATQMLTDVTLPAVQAREADAAAATAAAAAFVESAAQRQREADAVRKANDDLTRIEQQTAERRTAILENYREQSVRIERQRVLQDSRDQIDFARRRLKDLAKFNAQEVANEQAFWQKQQQTETKATADYYKQQLRALEDHHARLLAIQTDAETEIEQAAIDLDVSRAQRAMRAALQRTKEENQRYDEESRARAERMEQTRTELAEQRAAFAAERAARQQEFQARLAEEDEERRLAAERRAEDRRLEDQERQIARDRALNEIRDSYVQQTQARKAALQQELDAIRGVETAKVQAIQQGGAAQTAAIRAALTNMASGLTGGTTLKGAQTSTTSASNTLVQRTTTSVQLTSPAAATNTTSLAAAARARMVSAIQSAKHYASGGVAEGFAIVGEHGPELAYFPQPTRIYPSGAPSSIAVSMPVTVTDAGGDPARIEMIFEQRILPRLVQSVQRAVNAL